MSQNNVPRVLAIAIDAAESTLIRRMIEHDEMPALKSLLSEGRWLSVKAPAHVGSGSVWPTFMTGCDPTVHGVYGEWCWQPDTMSLSRYQGSGLVPFWKKLVDDGTTVGVLDLPFMPMLGLRNGFEISEWGPHDVVKGQMQIGPEGIRNLVSESPAHALSSDRLDSEGPDDLENLTKLASSCFAGVKLRGALAQTFDQGNATSVCPYCLYRDSSRGALPLAHGGTRRRHLRTRSVYQSSDHQAEPARYL